MFRTKSRTLALSQGFTLVELLVVIAIIGTLATLLLLQLGTARAKARDTKRISDINQMRTAMEQFFDDNGRYPTSASKTAWESGSNALVPKYIAQIPEDPLTPGCTDYNGSACYGYAFNPVTTPIRFHLWAELEQFNRAALGGDLDINSSTWSGSAMDASPAGSESCSDADLSTRNCIYDTGQR